MSSRINRVLRGYTIAFLFMQSHLIADWKIGKTENFEIISDASSLDIRIAADEFEKFRHAFLYLVPDAKFQQKPRLRIYLFDRKKDFDKFSPLKDDGTPKKVGGVFYKRSDAPTIVVYEGAPGNYDREVIYHELIHFLASDEDRRLPYWLSEGIAEVFSTSKIKGNTFSFGHVPDGKTYRLSKGLYKMEDIIAATRGGPFGTDRDKIRSFYAQSWAAVHMCFFEKDRKYLDAPFKYLRLYREPDLGTRFEKAFGVDPDTFDKELRKYVSGKTRFGIIKTKIPDSPEKTLISLRELTEAEEKTYHGDLMARARRFDTANKLLYSATVLDPDSPDAFLSRAMMYRYQSAIDDMDRDEQIHDNIARAIELQSNNPYPYTFTAKHGPHGNEIEIDERIQLIDTALALDPSRRDTYRTLGQLLTESESIQAKHIERMIDGYNLYATDWSIAYSTAKILAFSKRWGDLDAILYNMEKDFTSEHEASEIAKLQEALSNQSS
ncbi:MAG: tetratricopeptide repeat protein [Opitutales bacterium]